MVKATRADVMFLSSPGWLHGLSLVFLLELSNDFAAILLMHCPDSMEKPVRVGFGVEGDLGFCSTIMPDREKIIVLGSLSRTSASQSPLPQRRGLFAPRVY